MLMPALTLKSHYLQISPSLYFLILASLIHADFKFLQNPEHANLTSALLFFVATLSLSGLAPYDQIDSDGQVVVCIILE